MTTKDLLTYALDDLAKYAETLHMDVDEVYNFLGEERADTMHKGLDAITTNLKGLLDAVQSMPKENDPRIEALQDIEAPAAKDLQEFIRQNIGPY